jgi:hypothetical protein
MVGLAYAQSARCRLKLAQARVCYQDTDWVATVLCFMGSRHSSAGAVRGSLGTMYVLASTLFHMPLSALS